MLKLLILFINKYVIIIIKKILYFFINIVFCNFKRHKFINEKENIKIILIIFLVFKKLNFNIIFIFYLFTN